MKRRRQSVREVPTGESANGLTAALDESATAFAATVVDGLADDPTVIVEAIDAALDGVLCDHPSLLEDAALLRSELLAELSLADELGVPIDSVGGEPKVSAVSGVL